MKVCVSPKFKCRNPNPQGNGVTRWSFGEIIRSSGWSLPAWDLCPSKERPEGWLVFFLPCHGTRSPQATIKRMLTSAWPCWHPDLSLSASRTVGNKCLLLKPPSIWHFVTAAQAKTGVCLKFFSNGTAASVPGAGVRGGWTDGESRAHHCSPGGGRVSLKFCPH